MADANKGPVAVISGEHTGAIMDAKIKGCRVVTASSDKTLKMWDIRRTKESICTLYGHSA